MFYIAIVLLVIWVLLYGVLRGWIAYKKYKIREQMDRENRYDR